MHGAVPTVVVMTCLISTGMALPLPLPLFKSMIR